MNSLIIGYVQGDGYLTKSGSQQVQHSIQQKEFVYWLYNLIGSDLVGLEPKLVKTKPHKFTGKTYESLRFYTKNVFKLERSYLYTNNIIFIPFDIDLHFTPPISFSCLVHV